MTTESAAAHHHPRSRRAWATPSSARRTRASSGARASTSRTSSCPDMLWMDIVRSPYAHATIKSHRRVARRSPCRACSRSSPARTSRRPASTGCPRSPATSRWCCPTDTVMYQAQEVAAVIAESRYAAADGVAVGQVDYEPLPVVDRPVQGPRAGRARPPAGSRPGQGEQPHLALGVGRPRGHGRRARGGRPGPPRVRTSTSRGSTSRRSRRAAASPTGIPSAQHLDVPHHQPGAARLSGPCISLVSGMPERQDPGQDARHRRRLRRQGAGLPRLRPGRRRVADAGPAGQVDRGPLGEPAGRLVRPRLPHPRRAGRPRRTGKIAGLRVKTLADHGYTDAAADPSKFPAGLFNVITGSYDMPARVRRGRRRLHEQAAGRRGLPLLVPRDRGGPRDRAAWSTSAARDRHGPGRVPPEELHPARAVPVPHPDGLGVRLGQLPGRPAQGHGPHRLRRPAQGAGREARPRRAHGHRHQLVHRDRRAPGPSHDFDIIGIKMFDSCEIRVHPTGSAIARIGVQTPGPGPRDDVRPDHRRGARASRSRQDQDRGGRHGHGALRPGHVRLAVHARRRRRDGRRRPQDPRQGAPARRPPARGQPGRPRVDERQVQREGLAGPGQDHRRRSPSPPTPTTRRAWRPASRRSTTTTRPT